MRWRTKIRVFTIQRTMLKGLPKKESAAPEELTAMTEAASIIARTVYS